MASRSFVWGTEMFVSRGPTPAVWPKGGTLSSVGGPCLSEASWSALLRLASNRFNKARRGVTAACCVSKSVTVIGSFCRNKRASPAGAKPGFTENHVDTRGGDKVRYAHRPALFRRKKPKMDSSYTSSSCKAKTINSV